MTERLFLNSEVSKIMSISPRQIISMTEKGLVHPERPSNKTGVMRGYNYINLLEFGIIKYLTDVICLQFFTIKTIMDDLRQDGEIEIWASNYASYKISFHTSIKDKQGNELAGSNMIFHDHNPKGIGGTLENIPKNISEKINQEGTLYYIFTNFGEEKDYRETLRIITPWNMLKTTEIFKYYDDQNVVESKAMIVINLGNIKNTVNKGIKGINFFWPL